MIIVLRIVAVERCILIVLKVHISGYQLKMKILIVGITISVQEIMAILILVIR